MDNVKGTDMIKEFLKKHSHLKIAIQEQEIYGGGFMVQVYNTIYDHFVPVYKHFVSNYEIEKSNVDFETMIMVPIENWLEELEKS